MTSGILAVLAILAVFVAIWLFIRIEHLVVRVVGFLVTAGGFAFLGYLFLAGRL